MRPLVSRLVAYARRLGRVATREHEVARRSDDLAVEAGAIRAVAVRQATAEKAAGAVDGPANRDAAILARGRSRRASQKRLS